MAIETEKLTKEYRTKKKIVRAVDSVDLRVPRGSIFGLLGENGAGKSTLIHMLMGITLPTSGSGKVLEYDIVKESLKIREKVGFMPENLGFYENLSAEQNLLVFAKLAEVKNSEERVKECLKVVGLWNYRQRKYKEMSTGMKQRLGLAQALLKDPELLILDEPTAGIDPLGIKLFKELLLELNREGRTIFISTHLLYEIAPIFTHVAIMCRGKIVVQGSVEELEKKVASRREYIYEAKLFSYSQRLIKEILSLNVVKEAFSEKNKLIIKCSRPAASELLQILFKYGVRSFKEILPSLSDIFYTYVKGELHESF